MNFLKKYVQNFYQSTIALFSAIQQLTAKLITYVAGVANPVQGCFSFSPAFLGCTVTISTWVICLWLDTIGKWSFFPSFSFSTVHLGNLDFSNSLNWALNPPCAAWSFIALKKKHAIYFSAWQLKLVVQLKNGTLQDFQLNWSFLPFSIFLKNIYQSSKAQIYSAFLFQQILLKISMLWQSKCWKQPWGIPVHDATMVTS